MKQKLFSMLSLFTSTATLLCCALPATLVTLGLGAAVAGAISAVPWLVPLSQNKGWIFLVSGAMITANGLWIWHHKRYEVACALPTHKAETASACDTASRFSRVVLWVSIGVYAIGFAVAYLALPLLEAVS